MFIVEKIEISSSQVASHVLHEAPESLRKPVRHHFSRRLDAYVQILLADLFQLVHAALFLELDHLFLGCKWQSFNANLVSLEVDPRALTCICDSDVGVSGQLSCSLNRLGLGQLEKEQDLDDWPLSRANKALVTLFTTCSLEPR